MSSRRNRIRRRQKQHAGAGIVALRVVLVIAALTTVLLGVGAVTAYAVVTNWMQGLPDVDSPDAFRIAQTTKIYSADGKLLANLYLENREVVPLSKISTSLAQGVIAVEDERFYQHDGVDVQGVLRAGVTDLLSGGTHQGASTLTMQYINNTILAKERFKDTFGRKFRQAYLARELEKRHTKDEILAVYLNTVYFGEGAYGAEAAAKTYFGRSASKLTLAQASMLAGLPQAPYRLSPYVNLKGAKARQAKVLERMVANGYVGSDEASAAYSAKLVLKRVTPTTGIYSAPYFVEHVKKMLQNRYNTTVVFKGGLRVYTTLDTKMQTAAEKSVRGVLNRPDDPDAGLVAIDPRNGYVKAMYGGKDFNKNKYNLATQGKRQPGSSFKTFVLVTALNKGIPPYRAINSSSPAVIAARPKPWVVSNSEGHGKGYITIQSATRGSVNTVFARLIDEIGAGPVARTAMAMGITSPVPAYKSIALGSSNVSVLDMASAYGTLATYGLLYTPTTITKIIDANGKVIYTHKPKGKRIVSRQVAAAVTKLLQGVITGGTGTAANIGRPAAGKTGTSQDYRDAWFVGYTPQLVCAVWNGYHASEKSMRNVHGRKNFGGTFPAQIWHNFMQAALRTTKVASFPSESSPKYIWKSTWSREGTSSVEPSRTARPATKPAPAPNPKPKPKPKPKPPPPDTTSTPNP